MDKPDSRFAPSSNSDDAAPDASSTGASSIGAPQSNAAQNNDAQNNAAERNEAEKKDAKLEDQTGNQVPSVVQQSSTGFRYSIRTLIAITIVVAAAAGWYGFRKQRTQRQLDIVQPLEKKGASASLWQGDVVRVTFDGDDMKEFEPGLLEPLAKLPYLKRLVLVDTNCDGRVLPYLAKLETLEELLIINADLAPADLAPLRQLKHLRSLWICNAGLSDPSLNPIGEMTSLRILNLNDNQISDNGLLRLAGLVDLERLHLSNSVITDNGIDLVKQTLLHVKIQREPFAGYQP